MNAVRKHFDHVTYYYIRYSIHTHRSIQTRMEKYVTVNVLVQSIYTSFYDVLEKKVQS